MVDLQSCYFCATPDDVGEYAVVPPRLGGDGRAVPLCDQCKEKLLRVMEPLIETVENGSAGDARNTDRTDTAAEQSTAASSPDDGGITIGASGGDTGASGDVAEDSATEQSSSAPNMGVDPSAPPQYRRTMRMLSNRPFPVERSEVESMLARAYDLEREEITAVLSHAVEEGRLIEENGELREP